MGYGSYVILLGVVKKMNHYTHLSLLLFLICQYVDLPMCQYHAVYSVANWHIGKLAHYYLL